MKPNTIILSLLVIFSFFLTACKKKEIFGHKTVGEATINGQHLLQYVTIEELISNQFWYLPLGGNVIAIEDDLCYLQMMLRDEDWKTGDLSVSYTLKGKDETTGESYDISGTMNGKLIVKQ